MKKLSLLFILLILATNRVYSQDTINIPGDYLTIQEGINASSDGDLILVADDTYYENINFKGKTITVASNFLIDGDTIHINNTIIDGSQPNHPDSGSVVTFNSGEDTTSVLYGFTITGGTGTYIPPGVLPVSMQIGGGILCFNSGATIKYNRIKYNSLEIELPDAFTMGGGIFCGPPVPGVYIIINRNIIYGNSILTTGNSSNWQTSWATGGGIMTLNDGLVYENYIYSNHCESIYGYAVGGGFRIIGDATVNLVKNTIYDNSSISVNSTGFAGGISCSGANAIIDLNIITNNSIAGASYCYGAAIYFDLNNDANWAVVKNNYISGNYHTNGICYGGAIGMYTSSPEIYNNVMANNSANYGGALYAFDNSKPKIINNTITNNTAIHDGGALYTENPTTQVLLMNSILWNNDTEIYLNGGTATVNYSDVEGGYTGTGNMNVDPLFRNAANDNFHLQSTDCGYSFNSLCIDAGDPAYEDLLLDCDWGLGKKRSDMGAFGGAVLVNDVPEENVNLPTEYSLYQNYPNPFNPTTTIQYQIPEFSLVTLKVYDLLGNEIATLMNEEKHAGTYELNWDAANLPSGIYFYRLQAGSFVQTRKMILLK